VDLYLHFPYISGVVLYETGVSINYVPHWLWYSFTANAILVTGKLKLIYSVPRNLTHVNLDTQLVQDRRMKQTGLLYVNSHFLSASNHSPNAAV
jgi:hypothetical protein